MRDNCTFQHRWHALRRLRDRLGGWVLRLFSLSRRPRANLAQLGVHLELAKNPTILSNILNKKAQNSQIPCE